MPFEVLSWLPLLNGRGSIAEWFSFREKEKALKPESLHVGLGFQLPYFLAMRLSKWVKLFVLWFPHLKNEDNSNHLLEL